MKYDSGMENKEDQVSSQPVPVEKAAEVPLLSPAELNLVIDQVLESNGR